MKKRYLLIGFLIVLAIAGPFGTLILAGAGLQIITLIGLIIGIRWFLRILRD